MLPGLNADPATLAKEADNFQRIAQELNTVMHHVEQIGHQLKANLKGSAGTAAQSALIRFHEASTKVNTELDEISANIGATGTDYVGTDDDQASALGSTVQMW
ncbi:WXG100 family type VII secretion target [Mycolicibacterium sp. HK-90]|uniref:WXG100 family type VII secretion target n=1 Tax=Mycolicibacterium TaxID=1866885 RepID=UPI002658D1F6|nr:WXG100 family type VII secretion target [Mycolicibacterium sp. HK-90]WKG03635.1 WXG100 family type VII secretion target [Mycolicibacterium sp. HK-90]